MIHIAIDPGVSGGLAWADPARNSSTSKPVVSAMPETVRDTVDLLADIKDGEELVVAYIEEPPRFVKALPGSSVAVLFRNHGTLLGACAALGIAVRDVPPQRWQKALGLGTSKGMTRTQWKNKLKEKAQRLFPSTTVTLKTADALLILHASCTTSL